MTIFLMAPALLDAAEIKGRVIQVRDSSVTIRLENIAPVRDGDRVELSFSAAGDVIVVGTWTVSAVAADGTVEATLVKAQAEPTVNLDAVIYPAGAVSESTLAGNTEDTAPPEEPPLNLPEVLGRRDATRDFSELAESTACDKGKIIRAGDRLAYAQVGWEKGTAIFDKISVQRLDLSPE